MGDTLHGSAKDIKNLEDRCAEGGSQFLKEFEATR